MSEKTTLTRCDVCQSMVPPDKAIYDKGVNYPQIAKEKQEKNAPGEDDDTVTICQSCNEKLVERDIPNTS